MSRLRALDIRQVLPWAVAGTIPALIQVGVLAGGGVRPRDLVIDVSSLSDEIEYYSGSMSLLGIVGWFCAATLFLFAFKLVRREHPLRRALFHLGTLSLILGIDDALLLHEHLPGPDFLPDIIWIIPEGIYALWILKEFHEELQPEWLLVAGAALGFGLSIVIDTMLEGFFEVFASGVVFAEENTKLFGIALWLGVAASIARRALLEDTTADTPA